MLNRKRGAWVNFSDSQIKGGHVAHIHSGCISTSSFACNDIRPVLTNGRIGSVSDLVTVSHQTSQDVPEQGQASVR